MQCGNCFTYGYIKTGRDNTRWCKMFTARSVNIRYRTNQHLMRTFEKTYIFGLCAHMRSKF
jgi:hypothetical protein